MALITDIHTHHMKASAYPFVLNAYPEQADLVRQHPDLLFSVGMHPWNLHLYNPIELPLNTLVALSTLPQVVMIGECGLDKNAQSPLSLQQEIFHRHIEISENLQKPLLVHCVGCFDKLIAARKPATQRWIIHGFRGKPQLAQQLLQHGMDISFGPQFNIQSVLLTPPERLHVETDDTTADIAALYQRIAAIKNIDISMLNAGDFVLANS